MTHPNADDARIAPKVKKGHKHHADDAFNADGSLNINEVKAAVAFWLKQYKDNAFSVALFTQYPIDERTDVLALVRVAGPSTSSYDMSKIEAGANEWLKEFESGAYKALLFKEDAIDTGRDLLLLVRQKAA